MELAGAEFGLCVSSYDLAVELKIFGRGLLVMC